MIQIIQMYRDLFLVIIKDDHGRLLVQIAGKHSPLTGVYQINAIAGLPEHEER